MQKPEIRAAAPSPGELVEQHRLQLLAAKDKQIQEVRDRQQQLRAEATALRNRAHAVLSDPNAMNTAGQYNLGQELNAKAAAFEAQVLQLVNVDLATLAAEHEQIRMGTYSSHIGREAEAKRYRARQEEEVHLMRKYNDTRAALIQHLGELATPETRTLALALRNAAAEVGAGATIEVGRLLILALLANEAMP